MKKKKNQKKTIQNCQIGDGTIKKYCYVCNKEIRSTQRYYGIGKDKKTGKELYRHLKCRASDYKKDKGGDKND